MALLFLLWGLCIMTFMPRVQPKSIDQMIEEAMPPSGILGSISDTNTVRMELDMMFKRQDWEEIERLSSDPHHNRHKRKARRLDRVRWTNNKVPYTLASNTFSNKNRQQIQAAIDDWERYTCLNFRQATSRDHNKVHIFNGEGCSSYIGMIGGTQKLSLASGCRTKGIIIHELGHAIGFYHEQTRPDRDEYVEILTKNIREGKEHNFKKYSEDVQNTYNVPYDYTSVMHYGMNYFSANEQPTIKTLDNSKQNLIGNRDGLSFRDVKMANLMYNCGGHCGSKTCPGEAFVGKDCQCWYPGDPVKRFEACVDLKSCCWIRAYFNQCSSSETKTKTFMEKNCRKMCGYCRAE